MGRVSDRTCVCVYKSRCVYSSIFSLVCVCVPPCLSSFFVVDVRSCVWEIVHTISALMLLVWSNCGSIKNGIFFRKVKKTYEH